MFTMAMPQTSASATHGTENGNANPTLWTELLIAIIHPLLTKKYKSLIEATHQYSCPLDHKVVIDPYTSENRHHWTTPADHLGERGCIACHHKARMAFAFMVERFACVSGQRTSIVLQELQPMLTRCKEKLENAKEKRDARRKLLQETLSKRDAMKWAYENSADDETDDVFLWSQIVDVTNLPHEHLPQNALPVELSNGVSRFSVTPEHSLLTEESEQSSLQLTTRTDQHPMPTMPSSQLAEPTNCSNTVPCKIPKAFPKGLPAELQALVVIASLNDAFTTLHYNLTHHTCPLDPDWDADSDDVVGLEFNHHGPRYYYHRQWKFDWLHRRSIECGECYKTSKAAFVTAAKELAIISPSWRETTVKELQAVSVKCVETKVDIEEQKRLADEYSRKQRERIDGAVGENGDNNTNYEFEEVSDSDVPDSDDEGLDVVCPFKLWDRLSECVGESLKAIEENGLAGRSS